MDDSSVYLLKLECENCGGTLELSEDQTTAHCPFCHADYKIIDERPIIVNLPSKTDKPIVGPTPGARPKKNMGKRALLGCLIALVLLIATITIPIVIYLNSDNSPISKARTTPESEPILELCRAIWGTDTPTPDQLSNVTSLIFSEDTIYSSPFYNVMTVDYQLSDGTGERVYLYASSDDEIDKADLTCFTGLEVLDTGHLTAFSGGSIVDFSMCKDLRSINLGWIYFSGNKMFANPENIESLGLSINNNNQIKQLALLTNLKVLDISIGSGVTNYSDIAALPVNDMKVTLNTSSSSSKDLSWLAESNTIESLTIYCFGVTDFSWLSKLNGLKSLTLLNADKLKDIRFVSEMTSLEEFSVSYATALIDLSPLSTCANLKSLSLNRTGATDFSVISGLTKLESLYLVNYGSGVVGFTGSKLTNLKTADVVDSNDVFLSSLIGAPLTSLTCYPCNSPFDCETFLAFPQLTVLSIADDYNLGDLTNTAALKGLIHLKDIELYGADISNQQDGNAIFALQIENLFLSKCEINLDLSELPDPNTTLHSLFIHDSTFHETDGSIYSSAILSVNDIVPIISEFRGLESLTLLSSGLKELDFCSTLTSLTYINVTDNYINDFTPLKDLQNLRVLYCGGNVGNPTGVLSDTVNIRRY
ncbi:MAG: hypothetical protein LBQ95_04775 [Lachnospiraceae bacterium]|jgi:hypothetical protein|nr:hypothetical protein [Lachnospiraceae bacterium]